MNEDLEKQRFDAKFGGEIDESAHNGSDGRWGEALRHGWMARAKLQDDDIENIRRWLKDPVAVHAAMLRGEIAIPGIESILHALGQHAQPVRVLTKAGPARYEGYAGTGDASVLGELKDGHYELFAVPITQPHKHDRLMQDEPGNGASGLSKWLADKPDARAVVDGAAAQLVSPIAVGPKEMKCLFCENGRMHSHCIMVCRTCGGTATSREQLRFNRASEGT